LLAWAFTGKDYFIPSFRDVIDEIAQKAQDAQMNAQMAAKLEPKHGRGTEE